MTHLQLRDICDAATKSKRPVTKPHIRHYEVLSWDPEVPTIKDRMIYDASVESDLDLAERFMLKHNLRYCLLRTWNASYEEPEDRWYGYQWFDGQATVIDKFVWDHKLSVPDPERPIGTRE